MSGDLLPEKLVRCFLKVKKDLADDHDDWSAKRREKVARAICVKQTGMKFQHHDVTIDSMFAMSFTESGKVRDISFSFDTPFEIMEKSKLKKIRPNYEIRDPDSKIIVGRAIFATTSSNFNEYEEVELKKATKTLPGIPCQVDHSESARDTFGVVTDGWWDNQTTPPESAYVAELEGSDPMSAKVEKGYLRGVSVAGGAEKAICSICEEEMDWLHEHTPGQTYEKKVCKTRFKGIYYRHLGFTPFPAIEGADANYVAASMSEAMENAMAFVEYRKKLFHESLKDDDCDDCDNDNKDIQKIAASSGNTGGKIFKETISMSTDLEKEQLREIEREKLRTAEMAREKATLEAELVEANKLKEKLNLMQEKEKARLIQEVIDLQLQLKTLDSKAVSERKIELEKASIEVLEAKVSVLKEFDIPVVAPSATPAGSRSKNFKSMGSKFDELDKARQDVYIREAKLEQLSLGLFQRLPSVSAVQTLKEWNPTMGQWNTTLSDLFKQVPKRGNR